MAGPKGGGAAAAPAAPAAPPTTLWDKLNAAYAVKTPPERHTAMVPIITDVAAKRDINPLLQVLTDTRPAAQKGAIIALFYQEIKSLYWDNPDWRGAVAASISALLESSDATVAMAAAAAVLELTGDGRISAAAIPHISAAVKTARTKAAPEVGLVLSFLVTRIRALGGLYDGT